MHGDLELTLIALVVLAALGCGLLLERFRQPAILGYIMAGVLLGPSLLGFVENRAIVAELAELGVLMLLFLIGMELNLTSFKSVLFLSVGTVLLQIGVMLAVMGALGYLFNLGVGLTLVLAFSIALSSTAVAVKMLSGIEEAQTATGKITIGVLIAQDLAVVPIILFLRGMGVGGMALIIFFKIALSIGILVGLIWYLSRREKLSLPFSKIVSGHEDLMPLAALLFCFGCASLSGLIGLSAPYGAFLGGLIIGNTVQSKLMIETTKPIQAVLMMVFFLSVGLLMDLRYVWDHLFKVFVLLVVITLGKTFLNIFILRLFKKSWQKSFLAGLLLSQMGEFAFLLATIGADSKLIGEDGKSLIISLAAISLAFSPLWLSAARRLHDFATNHSTFQQLLTMTYGTEIKYLGQTWQGAKTLWQKVVAQLSKSTSSNPPSKKQPDSDA